MEQQEYNQSDGVLFVKIGIFVLSIMAVIGLGFKYIPDAISVSNIGIRQERPIYSVGRQDNKIALSFNTAWGNEDTTKILEVLDQYNVKATFFVTGDWVENYPEDLKAIAEKGHDIGNYGNNYKHMTLMTGEQCEESIETVQNKVEELTGIKMDLFRAPYGDYNNTVVGAARELGYHTIQWNVDVYATTLKAVSIRV